MDLCYIPQTVSAKQRLIMLCHLMEWKHLTSSLDVETVISVSSTIYLCKVRQFQKEVVRSLTEWDLKTKVLSSVNAGFWSHPWVSVSQINGQAPYTYLLCSCARLLFILLRGSNRILTWNLCIFFTCK